MKGQTVTITGNGERTRYFYGWGDRMSDMLGKTFIVKSVNGDAINLPCNSLSRTYKWHPDDLTLTENLKSTSKINSKIKLSCFDPIMLDI